MHDLMTLLNVVSKHYFLFVYVKLRWQKRNYIKSGLAVCASVRASVCDARYKGLVVDYLVL